MDQNQTESEDTKQTMKERLRIMMGYILITTPLLILVLASPAYIAITETYNISFLFSILPTEATAFILTNYLTMPFSWLFFCMSLMLLPYEKKEAVLDSPIFWTVIICSSATLITTTVTTALLYAYSRTRVISSLVQSIQEASNNSVNAARWNVTQSRMRCCGANGPMDWTSSGYESAPCGQYFLPCTQAMDNSYFITWSMSILGVVAACLVAFRSVIQEITCPWRKSDGAERNAEETNSEQQEETH